MSIELECNENLNSQDNNQEVNDEKNIEILLETINKQIEYLNNKYDVFNFQENSIQTNLNSYFKDLEKIENNKELFSNKIDELLFLKNIISDKDRIILSLHQELESKDVNIQKMHEEISQLKKEKQEQEDSFQNIIKDFQFLNEYNPNNVNSNPNNFDINSKKYFQEKVNQKSILTTYIEKSETENTNLKKSHMKNNSNLIGSNPSLTDFLSTEKQITNQSNFNSNQNLSGEADQESLLVQVDLLTKEKNAIESQLVIIKLKYAELITSHGELQDERNNLLSKVEEMNQKLILKEEVISHLIDEKEKTQTLNQASINSNYNNNNRNNSNNNDVNNNNYNNYHTYNNNGNANHTMREFSNSNARNSIHAKYVTNNPDEYLVRINNNNNNNYNISKNSNQNNVSFTQRNILNDLRSGKDNNNLNYSNYENFANEKIIKKIQYNFEERQYSKRTNYNTTMGDDHIESEEYGNNSVFNKTEHQLNMENYKGLQKNQKTKSFGFIGSIKNFFTNDKK